MDDGRARPSFRRGRRRGDARRSAVEPLPDGGTNRLGFDRDTLKLAWLDPERLLWVRWQTVPQGQGAYSKEGHVVVVRDGDGFRELFRDSIYAYGSAGALDAASETLEIEYEAPTATLVIASTLRQSWSSDTRRPLDEYRGTSDGGQRLYAGESTTRTVWRYRLAGAELRFTSGERWVEYPATTYPRGVKLKGVARAFATSVDRLVRLNPRLAGTDRFDGRIRVDDAVGPYQPQNDDGLTD